MLDIPNVIMVNCDGVPAPFSHEAYGYMESFYPMQQVQWSCCGSDGFRSGNEEEFVCRLAEDYPNVTGAYLDDFFIDPYIQAGETEEEQAKRAKARLSEISEKLSKAPRKLDLHVVYYTRDLNMDVSVFEKVDMLSMWTWHSEDLVNVEQNFLQMERQFPDKKKMIGIYLFDYTAGHPVPIDLMEHQCNFALKMLKEGRIHGMIFLGNSTMGMRMESELWLREWIKEHKYTVVPD